MLRERFWDVLAYDVEDLIRVYGDVRAVWYVAKDMHSMQQAESAFEQWEAKMTELMDRGLGGISRG